MSESICLVGYYLPLEGAGLDAWIELDRELRSRGIRLAMLSRYAAPHAPFPVFPIPLSFKEYPESFPVAATVAESTSAGENPAWAQVDFTRWGGINSLEATAAGIPAGRTVLTAILEILKPACVLVWDDTTPVSGCLQQLCQKKGIPVQVLERGLLPGTLMIESEGIGARSDLRGNWMCRTLDGGPDAAAAFEAAKEYYLTKRPQKYAQPDYGLGAEGLRNQLALQGRRVVVHFGGVDAGLSDSVNTPLGRNGTSVFASSLAALRALKQAVRGLENTTLIFKPHPHDHTDYSPEEDGEVIILREANIHALVALADVVAAQFTTIQFETVFYSKPVLLLARSQWWGRNSTYEVNRAGDLAGSLEAALIRRDWPAKEANARAFIVWLLRRFLIAWEKGAPATAGIPAFADFLAEWGGDAAELPAANDRFKALVGTLRALGRDYSADVPLLTGDQRFSLIDMLGEAQRVRGTSEQVAVWEAKVDVRSRRTIVLHPPASVMFTVPSGERGRLVTAISMHPDMWEKAESGACEFTVRIDGRVVFGMAIDALKMPGDRRWHEIALDVPASNSGRHQIAFETKGVGSNNFRWALWREPYFSRTESTGTSPHIATTAVVAA